MSDQGRAVAHLLYCLLAAPGADYADETRQQHYETSRDATKRYEFHMLRVYMMYWYTWNLHSTHHTYLCPLHSVDHARHQCSKGKV